MNRQIFLTRQAFTSQRWLEAFPQAVVTANVHDAGPRADDLVWLSAELPDWRARILDLVAAGCPVVVLSLQPDQNEALAALELGARGYAHALATPTLLREIDTVVSHGGLWAGAELMARLVGALRSRLPAQREAVLDVLSPREAEVAQAVAAGRSNKEVARELGVTERTVKAHLGAVFEKLGVRDRLQLALRIGAGGTATRALETL